MVTKQNLLKSTMGKMALYDSPDRMLPTVTFTTKELPEIKDWNVGKKYKLEIEVEQTSMSKDEYMSNAPLSARFKITKVRDVSDSNPGKKGY